MQDLVPQLQQFFDKMKALADSYDANMGDDPYMVDAGDFGGGQEIFLGGVDFGENLICKQIKEAIEEIKL